MGNPTTDTATWTRRDSDNIYLSGRWDLLIDNARRRQLYRELGSLTGLNNYCWNLRDISALDSGGAMLLWQIWGRRWPHELDCRDEHRYWFKRLEQTPPTPASAKRPGWRVQYASGVMALARVIGGILQLVGQLMLDTAYCASHPRSIPWREISATVYRVGATSMLLLGVVGFAIGIVATIQIGMTLSRFGAEQMIVGLMAIAVLRELGAVIGALILAGRSGSAMTAGIAAMHITEEFDALRAFGASPTQRLVLPRVFGMALAMPLLVIWTDFTAMLGAAFTSQWYLGIGWKLFLERLPDSVQLVNFWIGLGKGVMFGFIISVVACYFGLTAQPNTDNLSRHTTLSVVTSLSLILLLDAVSGALLLNVGI